MKRVSLLELMDEPIESAAELAGNLADIEFANRIFGGIRPVLREARTRQIRTLLDVCCGSADVPLAVARDARRRGRPIALTVVDRSPQMLALARQRAADVADVALVQSDGAALPFGDRSFDMVTCNLALHHFEPDPARALLRELRRVARLCVLVCDLRRSRLGHAAALAWSRLGSRNRLTRHDAPLSVRRAYTLDEALALALSAGWTAARGRREAFFRMTLTDARLGR